MRKGYKKFNADNKTRVSKRYFRAFKEHVLSSNPSGSLFQIGSHMVTYLLSHKPSKINKICWTLLEK